MDKNSKHLFFTLLAVMTIVFYSCKKKKNETSEGIFAGETNSEIMLVTEGVNKTLNPSEGLQSEFVIDINNDSDNDFNFIAKKHILKLVERTNPYGFVKPSTEEYYRVLTNSKYLEENNNKMFLYNVK